MNPLVYIYTFAAVSCNCNARVIVYLPLTNTAVTDPTPRSEIEMNGVAACFVVVYVRMIDGVVVGFCFAVYVR